MTIWYKDEVDVVTNEDVLLIIVQAPCKGRIAFSLVDFKDLRTKSYTRYDTGIWFAVEC